MKKVEYYKVSSEELDFIKQRLEWIEHYISRKDWNGIENVFDEFKKIFY